MMRVAAVAAALFLAFPAASQEIVPEPEEYRQDDYRGEIPATLTGAIVVETETAYALWRTGRVAFVDVLPRAPRPANLPAGTIWREQKRLSIPGAIWLPNVGYGRLAEPTLAYFAAGLGKATADDRDAPVVFFCLAECWMSWNAAKRAIELGYERVYWFPEGTDGWGFQDYPTADLAPEPGY